MVLQRYPPEAISFASIQESKAAESDSGEEVIVISDSEEKTSMERATCYTTNHNDAIQTKNAVQRYQPKSDTIF